jgi:hypothetical protein
VRAKDAAYLLIPHAGQQIRPRLVQAVVGWFVVDFNARALSGNYSAEQVVRSVGATAASILVDALNARMPQQALGKIAELIGQLGDEATKTRAGERLVAIEVEMETPAYLEWLTGEIRSAMEAAGGEVQERRVAAVAMLNRENFINLGALPAMKHLATEPAVRTRLLSIAETVPAEGDAAPIVERVTERRKKALQALEGNATREHLPRLLALALNEAAPIAVRDYAFDRVGDLRDRSVIPQLWPLVQNAENDQLKKRLRWRAGELVLALGGEGIVNEFLGKLSDERDVHYEPEELVGYATRMSQMTTPPIDTMRRKLRSNEWYIRVIALDFLERRGEASDAAAMGRLNADDTPVVGEGWSRRDPAIPNVGKVAEAAIAAMRERLAQPSEAQEGATEAAPAGGN